METFIAVFVSGLASGGLYALLVTILNLFLLVRGCFYFAYPNIPVISMCLGWIVFGLTGDNLVAGILAMILGGALLTGLTEPIFRPLLKRRSIVEAAMLSVAIGIVLVDIHSHFVYHGSLITFPEALTGGGAMFKYGVIVFPMADIYAILAVTVIISLLVFFLYHNKYGKVMRAVGQNIDTAHLVGIPITRIGFLSFIIAGFVGGAAAVIMAAHFGSAMPGMGDLFAVKAMLVMMLAGSGNLPGGLICAFLLGISESLAVMYLPGAWTNALVFGFMMMIIIIKPDGLFGSRA